MYSNYLMLNSFGELSPAFGFWLQRSRQAGLFHRDLVEQFVGFFAKVAEIFGWLSAFYVGRRPIFVNSRILFQYEDNCRELCGVD